MYYLSTETIKKAYKSLVELELKDENIGFYFLLLKACGINKISYAAPNFIENNGLYYASRIASLFSPHEKQPKKFGFINPFAMKAWTKLSISEPLNKWVASRLKNNIVGGGTQWREIIDIDTKFSEKKIKFKYDYVNIIKNMAFDSSAININALAIWSNRFTAFDQKKTIKEISDEFIAAYKLDVDEIATFFTRGNQFDIDYDTKMHDASVIRSMIGNPLEDGAWNESTLSNSTAEFHAQEVYDFNVRPVSNQEVSIQLVENLLANYHQVILSGPPGTSKSFFATEIAKKYDQVEHVQFHPQYNYQHFVGGYIVDKSDVVYKDGVILSLLKDIDENKKYLIIIDEFNRANVSQVLGEVIQCLDRNASVDILTDGKKQTLALPTNVHILATLNTTDRTLGTIDYAIKRRFMSIYCACNPSVLIDLCPAVDFISLCDFLSKLNKNLYNVTSNRDFQIGHAVFLSDSVKNDDGKFEWDFSTFRILYNYKILPMIEDFCSGNMDLIEDIVGNKLCAPLDEVSFIDAIKEYLELQ